MQNKDKTVCIYKWQGREIDLLIATYTCNCKNVIAILITGRSLIETIYISSDLHND